MYFPRPLYRALPAIYALTGAAVLVLAGKNILAILSGSMLVVASATITWWRIRHRDQYDARLTARLAFEARKPRKRGSTVQIGSLR